MTAEQWAQAAFNFLGNIGGIAALVALALQGMIKGWISDKFATKGDLRRHGQSLEMQQESAKSQLRVAALMKLAEQRFSCVEQLKKSSIDLSLAVSRYSAVLNTEWDLGPDQMPEDWESQKTATHAAAVEQLKAFLTLNNLFHPFVPIELWRTGNILWDLCGQYLHFTPAAQSAEKEHSSAISQAYAVFGRDLGTTILSIPALADTLTPAKSAE